MNRYPEQQDRYKEAIIINQGTLDDYTMNSWGAPFKEGEQVYNNMEDFFQNSTWDNNVSISGIAKNSSGPAFRPVTTKRVLFLKPV